MKYYLIIIAVFLPIFLNAQGYLHTEGKTIVNGNDEEVLLRGMGLGGWMLQEGYMMKTSGFLGAQHQLKNAITDLIGQSGMEAFYNEWLNNYITEADVDSMAAWGFNSIRLPMHYNLYTLPIEEEPVAFEQTWLQKGFDLTDSLLKWCSKNEMYLILDLHAAPGGQTGGDNPDEISDYDPTKPSLWDSPENQAKTVALWQKLAERYANEEWIGGYDLINETHWDMTNNYPLKYLYLEITDSIRSVDPNHIIFIEGNWYANDFTGLTPPWDDNMVYSFHKYWSNTGPGELDWVVDQFAEYNVPLWLGESGENSNSWFTECIELSESHNIGWAWWPFKKIESISCPLSIIKNPGYDTLVRYWNPDITEAKPTAQYAINALMELAENLKTENCEFHPDVIDAMFRQVSTDDTKPFTVNNIPGVIYAADFDMGKNNIAYYDNVVADNHLSTGTYTAWNSGWFYRNDGVDIEKTEDNINSNGYIVGFIEDGEWMTYTVNIAETAVYKINVRTASENSNGLFYLMEDSVIITPDVNVASSEGWQTWQSIAINNIVLNEGKHKFKFYAITGGFNLGSFEFIKTGETVNLPMEITTAKTLEDGYSIKATMNKRISTNFPTNPINDFEVTINGTEVEITNVELDPESPRVINITINYLMNSGNNILLSYSGNQIQSSDATLLQVFNDFVVENKMPQVHIVPGKIEAEDYYMNNGFGSESTSDEGGGINLGWTDVDDYLNYYISVTTAGTYNVSYRYAGESTGAMELQLLGDDTTKLHSFSLPATGGWQTWQTIEKEAVFPEGLFLIRLKVITGGFNFNWFDISTPIGINDFVTDKIKKIQIYPNPANDFVKIKSESNSGFELNYTIINSVGQFLLSGKVSEDQEINVSNLKYGLYYLNIYENQRVYTRKLIISK